MTDKPSIDSIFCAAIEIESADERESYLESVCGGDAELRRQVDRLLHAHFRSGSILDSPAHDLGPIPNLQLTEKPGDKIGPYKLLELIGEGGMGLVYMAEQQQPVRRIVALKIIKPGMDTRQVIARFEVERQALAMMDHHNIARVLDANTTDSGRPYFVMELVKGIHITEYCDKNRLTPLDRLKLFVPVCHAIQHAHQKGIIHRDIKPTNVLVAQYDGQPVPKVIDFGIAKATEHKLTDRTVFTSMGQVLGTLEYMSPEQAEMNQRDIDTRSDVYSLGVLLYELLTGSTPITKEQLRDVGFEEMLRTVRETEPPKPSTRLGESKDDLPSISAVRNIEPAKLSRFIRGDLDWIVMKALDKQRSRRFQTADQLARDVERFLADEPVEARPPSATYQLHKFVSKNRRVLSVVTAFAIVLCLGAVASTWQAIRNNRLTMAAHKAEEEATTGRIRADAAEAKAAAHELTQASLAREQRQFYFKRILLADRERVANNTARASQFLDECPEALRGWEWRYLNNVCKQELYSLDHGGPVLSLAFSPDGKWLATGGDLDFAIRIWNAETRTVEQMLTGHTMSVSDLVFSPDGTRLISSGGHVSIRDRGEVKVWDVRSSYQSTDLPNVRFGIRSLAISHNGSLLACVHGEYGPADVTVWDLSKMQTERVFSHNDGVVHDVDFSSDGKRLVTGGESSTSGEFRIWNLETGKQILQKSGSFGPISSVRFYDDGKQLATGGLDRSVRVWDTTTGEEKLRMTGHTDNVVCVEFLTNRHLVSSGDDGTIKIWTAGNDHQHTSLRGHRDGVSALAVDPKHDRNVVSTSFDGTIKFWDTTDDETFNLQGSEITFSPDGRRLAMRSSYNDLEIWDAQSGLHLYTTIPTACQNRCISFSRDGQRIAVVHSGSNSIWILEAATGRKIRSWLSTQPDVAFIAFSPDGGRLATMGFATSENQKSDICIWDVASGKLDLRFDGHPKRNYKVGNIQYTSDGSRLATVCQDNTARIWNASTGVEIVKVEHAEPIIMVAISPDDRYVATASDDNFVKLWDMKSGTPVHTLRGHTQDVVNVAFSPDGKRLISGANDKTIKLWDVESGEEIISLHGHAASIRSIAFSPDGETIAGSCAVGNIRLWNAAPLTEDIRARRRAALIVNRLAAKPLVRAGVIAEINADENIDSVTKQHALDYAKQYHESAHFQPARFLVSRSDASATEYEAALKIAESSAELAPDEPELQNQLGMANYRAGNYRDAVGLLSKADHYYKDKFGGVPWNLAFLAMSYEKAVDHDQALKTLERLDRIMEPPPTDERGRPTRQDWRATPILRAWQKEATKLIKESKDQPNDESEGDDDYKVTNGSN